MLLFHGQHPQNPKTSGRPIFCYLVGWGGSHAVGLTHSYRCIILCLLIIVFSRNHINCQKSESLYWSNKHFEVKLKVSSKVLIHPRGFPSSNHLEGSCRLLNPVREHPYRVFLQFATNCVCASRWALCDTRESHYWHKAQTCSMT